MEKHLYKQNDILDAIDPTMFPERSFQALLSRMSLLKREKKKHVKVGKTVVVR
ncbi:hypothetical protein L195_g036076, partial [Trifolium pratense]